MAVYNLGRTGQPNPMDMISLQERLRQRDLENSPVYHMAMAKMHTLAAMPPEVRQRTLYPGSDPALEQIRSQKIKEAEFQLWKNQALQDLLSKNPQALKQVLGVQSPQEKGQALGTQEAAKDFTLGQAFSAPGAKNLYQNYLTGTAQPEKPPSKLETQKLLLAQTLAKLKEKMAPVQRQKLQAEAQSAQVQADYAKRMAESKLEYFGARTKETQTSSKGPDIKQAVSTVEGIAGRFGRDTSSQLPGLVAPEHVHDMATSSVRAIATMLAQVPPGPKAEKLMSLGGYDMIAKDSLALSKVSPSEQLLYGRDALQNILTYMSLGGSDAIAKAKPFLEHLSQLNLDPQTKAEVQSYLADFQGGQP